MSHSPYSPQLLPPVLLASLFAAAACGPADEAQLGSLDLTSAGKADVGAIDIPLFVSSEGTTRLALEADGPYRIRVAQPDADPDARAEAVVTVRYRDDGDETVLESERAPEPSLHVVPPRQGAVDYQVDVHNADSERPLVGSLELRSGPECVGLACWSFEHVDAANPVNGHAQLAVEPETGTPWLTYAVGESDLSRDVCTKDTSGDWVCRNVHTGIRAPGDVAVDGDGTVHLGLLIDGGLYYKTLAPGEPLSLEGLQIVFPDAPANGFAPLEVVPLPDGHVAFVYLGMDGGTILRRAPDGEVSRTFFEANSDSMFPFDAVATRHGLVLAYNNASGHTWVRDEAGVEQGFGRRSMPKLRATSGGDLYLAASGHATEFFVRPSKSTSFDTEPFALYRDPEGYWVHDFAVLPGERLAVCAGHYCAHQDDAGEWVEESAGLLGNWRMDTDDQGRLHVLAVGGDFAPPVYAVRRFPK